MERPGNYAQQSRTYDLTRGASPTVIRALAGHLGTGDGRVLLDLAGGTGNHGRAFAARGFRVYVLDASLPMLARVAAKMGPGRAIGADVHALPLPAARADCAMMVNAVHLVADPLLAFRQARRVIGGGPLVVTAFTRENLAALFVYEYFDLDVPPTNRPPNAQFVDWLSAAGFDRVIHERYVYTDTVDGSLNALHTNAAYLAGPAYLRNTSLWYALDEDTRKRGLQRLATDLRSGVLEERVKASYQEAVRSGHGTIFAAWP